MSQKSEAQILTDLADLKKEMERWGFRIQSAEKRVEELEQSLGNLWAWQTATGIKAPAPANEGDVQDDLAEHTPAPACWCGENENWGGHTFYTPGNKPNICYKHPFHPAPAKDHQCPDGYHRVHLRGETCPAPPEAGKLWTLHVGDGYANLCPEAFNGAYCEDCFQEKVHNRKTERIEVVPVSELDAALAEIERLKRG